MESGASPAARDRETRMEAARAALEASLRGGAGMHLNACVRCGLCGETCHVFLAEPVPENLPVAKAGAVAAFYRRQATLLGRVLPGVVGARAITPEGLAALSEAVHGRCTACGRCSLHCSIGLDIAAVIRAGRRMVAAAGMVPAGLQRTVDNQITTGNQMAIPRQELLSTLAWLTDDLRREMQDETVRIPVDEPGRRCLYLVNPREVKFFPLSLLAAAGVFHAAGESWTLSSRVFDVTNYGFFAADDAAAGELARRIVDEARALGVEEIVLSECGHGFRAFRWEAPNWLGAAHPVPVRSVLELLEAYLDTGRIRVDPRRNTDRVTLHDPCNLVRWGGMSEPQRRVLRRVVQDFVEMTPNRADNYCCGGGGGLLAISEYGERRVASGARKAEQIRATGASVIATPCHNCADQLIEISKRYHLGTEILSVVELVYSALVRPAEA